MTLEHESPQNELTTVVGGDDVIRTLNEERTAIYNEDFDNGVLPIIDAAMNRLDASIAQRNSPNPIDRKPRP